MHGGQHNSFQRDDFQGLFFHSGLSSSPSVLLIASDYAHISMEIFYTYTNLYVYIYIIYTYIYIHIYLSIILNII